MQECPEKRNKLEKFEILEHHQNCILSFKRHVTIGNRTGMLKQNEIISEENLRRMFFCKIKEFIFALIHKEVIIKGIIYSVFLNKCKRRKSEVRDALQTY